MHLSAHMLPHEQRKCCTKLACHAGKQQEKDEIVLYASQCPHVATRAKIMLY